MFLKDVFNICFSSPNYFNLSSTKSHVCASKDFHDCLLTTHDLDVSLSLCLSHACMHVLTHTCMQAYTHTHTHTDRHTNTHPPSCHHSQVQVDQCFSTCQTLAPEISRPILEVPWDSEFVVLLISESNLWIHKMSVL